MPVLFNGVTNIPDYGSLTPTDADRIMKCQHPDDGGHNLRVLYLDYVKDTSAELYAKDDIIVTRDLCNEPFLHYKENGEFVREVFLLLLENQPMNYVRMALQLPLESELWARSVMTSACILWIVF